MKKFLAFICKICPFCILRRKFPKSKFAQIMKKEEKICPFCKAYHELYIKGEEK